MEVSGQLHGLAALTWRKRPGTHWIGGWVGPRASMNAVAGRNIPASAGNGTPVVQILVQILYWLSYSGSQSYMSYH